MQPYYIIILLFNYKYIKVNIDNIIATIATGRNTNKRRILLLGL